MHTAFVTISTDRPSAETMDALIAMAKAVARDLEEALLRIEVDVMRRESRDRALVGLHPRDAIALNHVRCVTVRRQELTRHSCPRSTSLVHRGRPKQYRRG